MTAAGGDAAATASLDSREDRSLIQGENSLPNTARAGIVLRKKLVDRLSAAWDERVVAVIAPAGYGKSTLLSQWAQHDSRPAAWVTVGRHDDDPAILLSDIRSSLQNAGLLIDVAPQDVRIASSNAVTLGVTSLIRDLAEATPGLLVLDGAQYLRSRASRDVVAELAMQLPRSITFVVASRCDIQLPTERLRTRGELLELSAADLALTAEETTALAAQHGISTDGVTIDELLEYTEGWPVGIYLTLLATKEADQPVSPRQIRGDDRFVADYFRRELTGNLSPTRRSFLTQTSILTELSGPLCDFVLEQTRSHRILDALERSNLLIIPLDHQRHRYRYHHLLRQFLHAELERDQPESLAGLHRRAAIWYDENHMAEKAIDHAMAAEDEDLVVRLLAGSARTVFAEGHADTVVGWLAWFENAGRMERHPGIAVLAALTYAHFGDVAAARRWTAMVDAVDDLGDFAPLAILARALMCPEGIEQMHNDAIDAQKALTPTSNWYAAAIGVEGLALLLSGQIEAADARLALASEIAERYAALPTATFAMAARSAIASRRGETDAARALAERSVSIAERGGLEGYATSVLPFVMAARAATHRGEPAEARRLLSRATSLRPRLSAAMPVISVQSLLEMVEAEIELGDIAGARQVLRETDNILRQCSALGPLEDRYVELKERVAAMPTGQLGAATLTNAELRLLPLLATHLSFPELGERLYISRHTVKTQAMSIYRKLGASSRSEAVQLARDLYLLEG